MLRLIQLCYSLIILTAGSIPLSSMFRWFGSVTVLLWHVTASSALLQSYYGMLPLVPLCYSLIMACYRSSRSVTVLLWHVTAGSALLQSYYGMLPLVPLCNSLIMACYRWFRFVTVLLWHVPARPTLLQTDCATCFDLTRRNSK